MALRIPPELKKITQYIRRAEELSKQSNPSAETIIVAFHCRQYAVQTGIPLASTPEAKKCLGEILDILEEHRAKMGSFSKDEKYVICRDFAYKIFDKADSEDRSGKSGKATARTFYAAASFLDILKQFQSEEELEGEEALEQSKKSFYAKWKSTEILKAIKEGREIVPGGYGEANNQMEDEEGEGLEVEKDGSMRNVMPPPPAYPADSAAFAPPPMAPVVPPPAVESDDDDEEDNSASNNFGLPPPVPVSTPLVDTVEDEPEQSGFFGMFGVTGKKKKHSKSALADARELTQFALTAIDEKDGDLAIERLQQAIACLQNS